MKDYERYMNRQKVSDAGMETLLKLETERPERPSHEESRVPQWLKYVGMAACFCLMMGLFALPILQGARQRAAGPERVVTGELHFNELDDVPLLSGRAAEKGDTVTSMDKEALYALFGKVARWPDMGWEKYFTVSGQRRDKADGTREYALWGSDNVAGISSKFGTRSSGVWLELTENGAFFAEEWKELTVSVINSCEVVAVSGRNEEKGMYRAAAVFQTVSETGPYGVFYAVEATSEVYAKQLVTQMTDYLTANGIFVEEREILSVKFNGWYVMETDGEETWPGVPSVTFNEDGSFGVFVAYCSSHICQGDYEITDGRVTVRCPQHTYVFDILDENTLRFVGAESSEPERYGDDDWPHITDGAVFRLQDVLYGEEVRPLDYAELTQPYAEVDFYKALEKNESRELTKDELAKVFPASDGETGVNYVWTGTAWFKDDGNLRAVVITGEKMDEAGTVILTLSTEEELAFVRNQTKKNGKTTYFGKDNTTYGSGMGLVRCFYVNEPGHFNNTPGAYWCYTQCKPASNPLYDYTGYTLYAEVRTSVSEGSLLENEVFNTQWFEAMYKNGLWFQMGNVNGKDIWQLPGTGDSAEGAAQVVGPYYLETEEDVGGRTLLPVITFYQDGNFQCTSDLASSHYCVGPYTVKNGRVTANCDQHRFVFDIDGDALRYVGAESDEMVRYTSPKVTDGAVFRRPDGADQWGRTYEFSPFRTTESPLASLEPAELGGRYHMEAADGSALANSYLEIERKKPYQDITNKKMTVHFASRNCVCDATLYNTTRDRITYICSDCKSVYTFDIVDSETLRYVASGNKDCIDDCTVFRHLKDGERAVTEASKPQVEITDLGSSLWEDRGSGTIKEGVSYELSYQANEAAAGKPLEFYLELSQEDQKLLGLDGPVCIQTYCREAGEEYKSSKKVYGDFEYGAVSQDDIGDVTVRCVCDGEEIARQAMPWGNYATFVWDVPQATRHPEPTHHVEESHHSDSHH